MDSPRTRKRYRYRLRRLVPVVAAVLVAGIGGAWVGARAHGSPTATLAASPGVAAVAVPVEKTIVRHEQLLNGDSTLVHTFRPSLLGKAAILVDATTGRVLWELHAHERRHVASTTKIMTALLALRKLGPHDVVTVDRSVPRVPLPELTYTQAERTPAIPVTVLATALAACAGALYLSRRR